MPRKPRVLFEGALYHVTSRGNARQVIFHHDGDRERFVEQLGDRAATFGVVVHAFVLMDNHYHLLVRTPRGNLNRFMQCLNTSYALYSRYKHRRPGHVFQGRYKALVVAEEAYLLRLTRYIHLNPIKTAKWRKAPANEVVSHLRKYRWSSYPSYAAGQANWPWLNLELLTHYGWTPRHASARYRAYAEAMVTENDEELMAALKSAEGLEGSQLFDPKAVVPARNAFDWDALDGAVAKHYGVEAKVLRQHGHVGGAAKRVAMVLAARWSGAPLREIGLRYGGVGPNAVNMSRHRLQPEDQAALEQLQGSLKCIVYV
ncbi:MAG TPA: transposase [Kiritimatiellia bacterium]|nr:transposase [Kiritimatiellia bacterium]